MLGPDESIYTMAANAVLDLIIENKIEPSQVGFLALGTESSTDNSAGTIIIKGMVNDELKNRGISPISIQNTPKSRAGFLQKSFTNIVMEI